MGTRRMLYAILCYDSEDVVGAWSKEKDEEVMTSLLAVTGSLADQGRLGPVARLLPTTAATTIRKGREPPLIDGPFAETKEQLLGFYVVDCSRGRQSNSLHRMSSTVRRSTRRPRLPATWRARAARRGR